MSRKITLRGTPDLNQGTITDASHQVVTVQKMPQRLRVRPQREAALEDAFAVVADQLNKLRRKSEDSPEPMPPKEANQVVKYVDVISKLVRTDIIHDQATDPKAMSDQDLLEALGEAAKMLAGEDIVFE